MEVSATFEVANFSRNLFVGHFFPKEDDKFLEKVQESMEEEEERQTTTAAKTNAAREAVAASEES